MPMLTLLSVNNGKLSCSSNEDYARDRLITAKRITIRFDVRKLQSLSQFTCFLGNLRRDLDILPTHSETKLSSHFFLLFPPAAYDTLCLFRNSMLAIADLTILIGVLVVVTFFQGRLKSITTPTIFVGCFRVGTL